MTDTRLRIRDIDWQLWVPQELTTLMFVVSDGHIVLMRKKRGLGAGKINGPGGRLEGDESALACAIRETREELLIEPRDVTSAGELSPPAEDHPRIPCSLPVATRYDGTPTETDEAIPLVLPVDAIPYDEMWPDNRYWLPMIIAGERVRGYSIFARQQLVDHHIDVI